MSTTAIEPPPAQSDTAESQLPARNEMKAQVLGLPSGTVLVTASSVGTGVFTMPGRAVAFRRRDLTRG